MKKIITLLTLTIFSLFLLSCEKQQKPEEVTFTLSVSDFEIMTTGFNNLKSVSAVDFNFQHKYKGSSLTFINSNGVEYNFNTATSPLDSFEITLPIGEYILSGESTVPDIRDEIMSFTIPTQTIIVEENMIQLNVVLTPTCALILVSDEENLLNESYLASNGSNHCLYSYNTLIYCYFRIHIIYPYLHDHFGFIKHDGNNLSVQIKNLKVGYIYKIIVTSTGTTQVLTLDPTFQETEPISW